MLHASLFRLAASGLALLGGCGAGGASRTALEDTAPVRADSDTVPAQAKFDSTTWVVSDSAARTAELSIVVTRPPTAESALLNGYRRGQARIIVPVGWTVRWNWRNADSSSRHSLVVMAEREKVPLEGGRPAFSNAMTRMVTEGLPPGETDQTTFEAEQAGWYWLLCGVPSHALEGEWLELRIDPDSTSASVRVKK